MKKHQPWATLVLLLVLLSACSEPKEQEVTQNNQNEPATEVAAIKKSKLQLVSVTQKDKAVAVLVSGRVVAKNATTLTGEVQGKLVPTSIRFKEGVRFAKGQTLLEIDREEFALNLESQRSSFLNTLTGMMPDMKEDYPANYRAWLAYVEAYELGKPLADLPATQSDSEKYFVTSRGIYTSFYAIRAVENRLQKYVIRAPYDGIITQANIDVGGMVTPGMPLGKIISTSGYELEAGVALDVASTLSKGDQLRFASNQQAGAWTGTVVRIGGVVDPKTQNVPVFFSMQGSDLRPGMYLEGSLSTKDFQDVFVVHNSVLGRDQSVLILEKDLIVRKSVEPVEYVQDSVLVRGLNNRDQLILNQFTVPVEGQKVALQ